MSPPHTASSNATRWPAARGGPPSVADLTQRGFARLAERIDASKSRHKPLSLLRQEGKRVLEQLLDAEGTHLSRGDRDRVIEDVLGGALGFCPLEELFRDETRQEILTLAWNQVIARTGEQWLPTSTRFRDADQYREFVLRLADVGTAVGTGAEPGGAFDVILPNGFRAVAILPPGVLGQPPLVLLARGDAPTAPPPLVPARRSGTVSAVQSRVVPAPPLPQSAVLLVPAPRAVPAATGSMLGPMPVPPSQERAASAPDTGSRGSLLQEPTGVDPFARLRSRVTERLIARCASVGVFDIRQIPSSELRRILTVHIGEVAAAEQVRLDETGHETIALQILAAMNR